VANRSSAYDIAKLCCKSLKNGFFNKIVNTKEYTSACQKYNWKNTNKLLEMGFHGVKTGNTENVYNI
jgi:D-alanyl-D-alanine carboxypeptidase